MSLVDAVVNGNRRALARMITQIENDPASAATALALLFPHTGQAHLVGITGAPGVGKSSLVNQMALHYRKQDRTVGIVAVDPTSPFSGGAILGDRIRMRDLAGDRGVFIRSMATRGSLGGLARAVADVVKALDAAGFDVILIETVGAGQSEVDIARHAQTVVVVEAPGLGDDVQAIKAGILEIADILAVNKADDPRAVKTEQVLRGMLQLASPHEMPRVMQQHGQIFKMAAPSGVEDQQNTAGWEIPVQPTEALSGSGVEELLDAIDAHRMFLTSSGELARRDRIRLAAELDHHLRDALVKRLIERTDPVQFEGILERVALRELVPQEAVELLLGA